MSAGWVDAACERAHRDVRRSDYDLSRAGTDAYFRAWMARFKALAFDTPEQVAALIAGA